LIGGDSGNRKALVEIQQGKIHHFDKGGDNQERILEGPWKYKEKPGRRRGPDTKTSSSSERANTTHTTVIRNAKVGEEAGGKPREKETGFISKNIRSNTKEHSRDPKRSCSRSGRTRYYSYKREA